MTQRTVRLLIAAWFALTIGALVLAALLDPVGA